MFASSERIEAYFSHLVSRIGNYSDVYCIAVAHMVPNTLTFAPALGSMMNLSAILAKPKSVEREEYKKLKEHYEMPPLSREWAADYKNVIDLLENLGLRGKKVVLVDIGGYFSQSINNVSAHFEGEIIGLLEGTENGLAKYEENRPYKIPIITVARSPLKLPEDHLVASSIVFSIEAVLREQAEILQTRSAAVIGYGRVGRSVAGILRSRGINAVVHDTDPVKLAEAAARGFQASIRLNEVLMYASLVVCATGNRSLDLGGFGMLQSGCVVASVTSADDEFDLDSLKTGYIKTKFAENLVQYKETRSSRHFFMIADGNAANFIHGAIIGPAIQLIEGEKLMAVKSLIDGNILKSDNNIHEVDAKLRKIVAEIWIEHFL